VLVVAAGQKIGMGWKFVAFFYIMTSCNVMQQLIKKQHTKQ